MLEREPVTFPGPGGSRISCCIIPCGCILVLAVGLFAGGLGLALHVRGRSAPARVTPVAGLASPMASPGLPPRWASPASSHRRSW